VHGVQSGAERKFNPGLCWIEGNDIRLRVRSRRKRQRDETREREKSERTPDAL